MTRPNHAHPIPRDHAHRPDRPLHPAVAALFAVVLLLGLFAVTVLFFAGALS